MVGEKEQLFTTIEEEVHQKGQHFSPNCISVLFGRVFYVLFSLENLLNILLATLANCE